MESKLADDIASLSEILQDFRWFLTLPTDKCDWQSVINYLGHIELYRREIIDQAKEALERGAAPKIAKHLMKLTNEELAAKRKENYMSILLHLCRSHIQYSTCSEQDYIVPSLLKKYYPPREAAAVWAPHVGLSIEERGMIEKEKETVLLYLKKVTEWESKLEDEGEEEELDDSRRRSLYLDRFGDPFERETIDAVALAFAAKVENNANALDQLLNILGS